MLAPDLRLTHPLRIVRPAFVRRLLRALLVAFALVGTDGGDAIAELASWPRDGGTTDASACPECDDCSQCDCCGFPAPAVLPTVSTVCALEPERSVQASPVSAVHLLTAPDIFHPPRA